MILFGCFWQPRDLDGFSRSNSSTACRIGSVTSANWGLVGCLRRATVADVRFSVPIVILKLKERDWLRSTTR